MGNGHGHREGEGWAPGTSSEGSRRVGARGEGSLGSTGALQPPREETLWFGARSEQLELLSFLSSGGCRGALQRNCSSPCCFCGEQLSGAPPAPDPLLCPGRQQAAILEDLVQNIPLEFDFLFSKSHAEVISGKQEGRSCSCHLRCLVLVP